MITIKEIARILGVSPTTVSNVVNGHTEKMSADTRKKVEEALVNYHYYTNRQGTEIAEKSLHLITVEFYFRDKRNVITDPFCSEFFDAVCRKLQEYGRYPVCGIPKDEEEVFHKLKASCIEGAIVIGFNPWDCEFFSKRTEKPVVFVDCGDGNYDNIGTMDYEGSKEITEYMIKQGHRRIAFFCDRKNPVSSTFERFRGYVDALKEADIAYTNRDYHYLPDDRNLRREAIRNFIVTAKERGYTAAVVVSDLLANEVVNVISSEGLRVPEDMSVAGFDDNIYARLCRPMLTTVRQHVAEKGEEAVKLLMKRIYREDVLANSFRLPVELIVRDSVNNIN